MEWRTLRACSPPTSGATATSPTRLPTSTDTSTPTTTTTTATSRISSRFGPRPADRCRPQRAARLPMGRQAQPFRADPLSSRYEVDPLHLQQRVRVRLLLRRRPRAHLHV